MLKAAGTDPIVNVPQASAPAPFPLISWMCCREEGSLLSKPSLNGDGRDMVSPVGHRVILECHPLRQLTRGLTSEISLGSSGGVPCESFSDSF